MSSQEKKARMKERKTERSERENVEKDILRQSALYRDHYNDIALLTDRNVIANFLRLICLEELPARTSPRVFVGPEDIRNDQA